LAKKIKQKNPNIIVVFGGAELFPSFANEIIEKCPFIDHIILGQGEKALLDIVNNATRTKVLDLSGSEIYLDDLLIPHYDTYFNECKKIDSEKKSDFQNVGRIIPIMGGRGCWWAEKSRCSFCGGCGDDEQKNFQRTPADIVREMRILSKRYKSKYFNFIDAIDPSDFYSDKGLLKLLSRSDEKYVIFHQLRAPRKQSSFRMLDDANVRIIQPGLESLDSNILRLMRKGITAKDVLRCLYWSKVYNIEVSWNILVGHPGEQIEWVYNIAKIIPKIYHLPPPARLLYVQFHRGSPILNKIVKSQNEVSPIRLIPDSRLSYLYPEDWNYQNLSYEFENPYEVSCELKKAHGELDLLVSHWCNLWESNSKPQLYVDKTDNKLTICDMRSQDCREYTLKGRDLEVAKQIVIDRDRQTELGKYSNYKAEISNLIDKGIVMILDGCLIWLPTFQDEMIGGI
ncbi:radical SAM protein, partial [Patescibacteria group bacterium]|nr:radical SAM protein [Patescibacteria group bacterium]